MKDQVGTIPVVELFIIVVAIAAVSFAVYASLRARGTFTLAPMMSPSASPLGNASPLPAASEFDVPELGFKLAPPSGLPDLVYSTDLNRTGSLGDGTSYSVSTVKLSSQSLQQAGGSGSSCSSEKMPLGLISRYSFDPTGKIMDVAKVKKVGSFYLAYAGPQSTCTAANAANATEVNDLQSAQVQLMQQAFATAAAL
ncbi:MAG TPA: hypothetical protein VLI05_02455 [Candidatus Saccharimonadia bacterium]|nr:hypothetical protein [Candidatus Saccharimonadia bacterium]